VSGEKRGEKKRKKGNGERKTEGTEKGRKGGGGKGKK